MAGGEKKDSMTKREDCSEKLQNSALGGLKKDFYPGVMLQACNSIFRRLRLDGGSGVQSPPGFNTEICLKIQTKLKYLPGPSDKGLDFSQLSFAMVH